MISVSLLDLTVLAWSIWAAGAVLLLGLTLAKSAPNAIGQMWRLFISEGFFIAVATLPFLIGGLAVPAAIAVLALRAGWEGAEAGTYIWSPDARLHRHIRLVAAAIAAAAAAAGWLMPPVALAIACIAVALAYAALRAAAPRVAASRTVPPLAVLIETAAFPGILIALFAFVARNPGAYPLIVLAFLHVEIFDSLAVLGGKLFGRTPFFRALSPNKTWEGFFTGLLALAALSLGYNLAVGGAPLWTWACLVVAGGVGAVLGDVATSLHKRLAGLKDYPAIYGPQGGALDMVDAWLVAVPLTAATAWALGAFAG